MIRRIVLGGLALIVLAVIGLFVLAYRPAIDPIAPPAPRSMRPMRPSLRPARLTVIPAFWPPTLVW